MDTLKCSANWRQSDITQDSDRWAIACLSETGWKQSIKKDIQGDAKILWLKNLTETGDMEN